MSGIGEDAVSDLQASPRITEGSLLVRGPPLLRLDQTGHTRGGRGGPPGSRGDCGGGKGYGYASGMASPHPRQCRRLWTCACGLGPLHGRTGAPATARRHIIHRDAPPPPTDELFGSPGEAGPVTGAADSTLHTSSLPHCLHPRRHHEQAPTVGRGPTTPTAAPPDCVIPPVQAARGRGGAVGWLEGGAGSGGMCAAAATPGSPRGHWRLGAARVEAGGACPEGIADPPLPSPRRGGSRHTSGSGAGGRSPRRSTRRPRRWSSLRRRDGATTPPPDQWAKATLPGGGWGGVTSAAVARGRGAPPAAGASPLTPPACAAGGDANGGGDQGGRGSGRVPVARVEMNENNQINSWCKPV